MPGQLRLSYIGCRAGSIAARVVDALRTRVELSKLIAANHGRAFDNRSDFALTAGRALQAPAGSREGPSPLST